MGALSLLGLIFLVLMLLAAFSFAKGNQIAGMGLIFIVVTGAFILGYLWFNSPM